MRRVGKGFSGRVTPLFPTIMVQSELGEGSAMPTDPHHTPTILQSASSQPQKTHKPRKPIKKATQNRSRTHKLKRLYKVGLSARVESLDEASLGEDASKQGREIDDIDQDEDITLVDDQADAEMFDVNDLGEITLAQALEVLKTSKPKDKGKGIMIEEPVKSKKIDQIRLDEETALRLQAEFDEEERLARERTQKEQEANIALIETWDDIQAKIDSDYQLAKRLQA
uniref:Uncharacterized protein n=1 Tax=Tanacetum cinerariifolium TaxID=118510 RepID=A0A6L2KAN7_TANCI|nr:hypothetical protein [Tanacetum cinerariifolium]